MGTSGGLCVGTAQHSLLWMEVSMQLIVAQLLLEAYGLTVIEILFSVQGESCLFVTCEVFPEQISSLQPENAPSLLFWTGGVCVFCTTVND